MVVWVFLAVSFPGVKRKPPAVILIGPGGFSLVGDNMVNQFLDLITSLDYSNTIVSFVLGAALIFGCFVLIGRMLHV